MTIVDIDGYERDLVGRKVPQRFNVLQWIRAIPGFLGQFRPVPIGKFTHTKQQASVECPCGRTIVIETGHLRNCDGCERTFLYGSPHLLVGNSPVAGGVVDKN